MRTTPEMKAVIEALANKHDVDIYQPGAMLRLDMKGFDQLQIECFPNGCVSVAHYFESQGQRIPEPDIGFGVDEKRRWVPINITQSLTGYQSYAEIGKSEKLVLHNPEGQMGLANFCEQWAQNLVAQKWLENAMPHQLPEGHLFELGRIVATPGALEALEETGQSPDEFINRHISGDWGTVPPEDAQANQEALDDNGRVHSAYILSNQTKIWLITEWDRSATTLLRPEEY